MRKKNFFKKPRNIIFLILALVIIVGVISAVSGGDELSYESTVVERGDLIQTVSVTGRVKAAKSADLAFEKGGRVSRVNVEVGEKVIAGDILAELENGDLVAQLDEAKASISVQQAKLDELIIGTRQEEIEVKQAALNKASQDLRNDYAGVADVINDAYAKADDAVRNKTDALFTSDESANPQLSFTVASSSLKNDAELLRLQVGGMLTTWQGQAVLVSQANTDKELDAALSDAEGNLKLTRKFLDKTLDAINGAAGLSSSTTETYRTSVNTGRTNVNTALTSINTRVQKIASQKLTVQTSQEELNLALAGATTEQIAAQAGVVRQTEAQAENIRAQIEKTLVRAPIRGVVTRQDAKAGEIVSAGAVVVSLISETQFKVESNIPEADIANVSIGDIAEITLDAYRNDVVFVAEVVSIDPAETIIDGVATYKVEFQFMEEDERIKSGMTANIDITTDTRENVLAVPQRAVTTKDGSKIIRVVKNEELVEVDVTIGLRGSDGRVEILSGLAGGEEVVTFIKE